jgi:hypothetical protein
MLAWNVPSCALVCRFRSACIASVRKSRSGFPSAVSRSTAPSSTGYFCRCSAGRFRKCFRSYRRAAGSRSHCWRPRVSSGAGDGGAAHLEEEPELGVGVLLVLDALLREREVADVAGVREPELGGRAEEDVADALDHGRLLALAHAQLLEQPPVALAQVEHVVEHVLDQRVQPVAREDRGRAERADEELRWGSAV